MCLPGFSLNGELMMDRMGQEIAFKGIDLSCQYVPAFSLSAGQHARVNFGQVRALRWLYSSTAKFLTRFTVHIGVTLGQTLGTIISFFLPSSLYSSF